MNLSDLAFTQAGCCGEHTVATAAIVGGSIAVHRNSGDLYHVTEYDEGHGLRERHLDQTDEQVQALLAKLEAA